MKIANFDSQKEYVTVELCRTNGEVASVVVICFGETKLSWHAPRICQFVRKYYWIPRYVTYYLQIILVDTPGISRAVSHRLSIITKHKIYLAVRSLLFNAIILTQEGDAIELVNTFFPRPCTNYFLSSSMHRIFPRPCTTFMQFNFSWGSKITKGKNGVVCLLCSSKFQLQTQKCQRKQEK